MNPSRISLLNGTRNLPLKGFPPSDDEPLLNSRKQKLNVHFARDYSPSRAGQDCTCRQGSKVQGLRKSFLSKALWISMNVGNKPENSGPSRVAKWMRENEKYAWMVISGFCGLLGAGETG